MPKIKFSQSDLLATNQLDANWYDLEVKDVSDWRPSKNDPTSNVIDASFEVCAGPKAGTPVQHWFSEKSIGKSFDMLGPYLMAFTPDGKLDPNKEYEAADTKGRKVKAYIKYDTERKANVILEFRSINFRAAATK